MNSVSQIPENVIPPLGNSGIVTDVGDTSPGYRRVSRLKRGIVLTGDATLAKSIAK